MSDSLVENALQDTRVEWVEESTVAVPPTDPSWNTLADYLVSGPGASTDRSDEQFTPVGSNTPQKHFQGPEDHSLSFEYLAQQFPVDASSNVQDPSGYVIQWANTEALESLTVVQRSEETAGGNFGSGTRTYVVGLGCKPSSVTWPGDAAESRPIVQALDFEATLARSYVVHQPDSSTTLEVSNDGSSSIDVTIENEGAGTTETVTVSAGGSKTTTSSFGDIDAIWANSVPDGAIRVTDGGGTTVLETIKDDGGTDAGLAGDDTTRNGERGIPPLGTGSHASAIGQDPENYQFHGTSTTFGGNLPGVESLETQDVTVEIDIEKTPRQGDRGQRLDPGVKTCEVDIDTSGSQAQYRRVQQYLRGLSGDVTYSLPDGDLTVKSAQATETDDFGYSAEDANVSQAITLAAKGDNVLVANHN